MIKVLKFIVTGEIEVFIEVEDTKALERYRKALKEAYQIEGQKPFHIDFTLQSENFTDVYIKHKKA